MFTLNYLLFLVQYNLFFRGTLLPSSSEAAPLGESTLPIYQDLDAYKPLVDTDYPDQESK